MMTGVLLGANPVEGEHQLFGFLTTDANAEVGAIHPKAMPVILTQSDQVEAWLTLPVTEALQMQKPLTVRLKSSRRAAPLNCKMIRPKRCHWTGAGLDHSLDRSLMCRRETSPQASAMKYVASRRSASPRPVSTNVSKLSEGDP
jgi:hypothetical protein